MVLFNEHWTFVCALMGGLLQQLLRVLSIYKANRYRTQIANDVQDMHTMILSTVLCECGPFI